MAIEKSQILELLNAESSADEKAENLSKLFQEDFEEQVTKIKLNREQIKAEKKDEIDKRHAIEGENAKLQEQLKQMQEQLKANSPEEIQKVYESQLTEAKKLFDGKVADLEKQLATEKQTVDTLNQEKFKLTCMEEFNKSIAGKNIAPDAVSDLSRYVLGENCNKFSKRSLGDGTEVIVTEDGKTIKGLLEDVLNNTTFGKRCVVVNTSGGGAEGGSANVPTGMKNPWKKESFNLTKQAEIARDDPQLAATLKAQANA
ncbi:MAG: hypothetical protein J6S85_19575 [Methanobrevibacter sp.]|nr:hypothetical protein [Methanobrevibacter sp.]